MQEKAQIRIRIYDIIYCSRRPIKITTRNYEIETSNMECLESAWGAVRRSLARHKAIATARSAPSLAPSCMVCALDNPPSPQAREHATRLHNSSTVSVRHATTLYGRQLAARAQCYTSLCLAQPPAPSRPSQQPRPRQLPARTVHRTGAVSLDSDDVLSRRRRGHARRRKPTDLGAGAAEHGTRDVPIHRRKSQHGDSRTVPS